MNTKVVGVVAAAVVCVFVVIRMFPAATPPLAYGGSANGGRDDAATAFVDAQTATSLSSRKSGGGDSQTVAALRAQLEEIRALLKSAPATPSAAVTASAQSRSCPPCSPCLQQKCPKCEDPTTRSAPAASASGSGSSVLSTAERCAKMGLNLPAEIKRLTLQVGPHMSPLQSEGSDHAVITFEPQAHIVHHINEKRLRNVYAVPAAVSLVDGLAMFDLAEDHSQSASLNAFNPKIASWSGRKVLVPVIRLQTVLECLGDRFSAIDYFLCDAQGSDLDVMKSAGAELRRFRKIEMEVQVNKFAYYQSDNSKAAVVKYMKSMGFRETAAHCNGVDPATHARDPTICEEENVTFMPDR